MHLKNKITSKFIIWFLFEKNLLHTAARKKVPFIYLLFSIWVCSLKHDPASPNDK